MARRRTLHADEHALWQAVARSARPMHPQLSHRTAEPSQPLLKPAPPAPPPLPQFRLGEKATRSAGPDFSAVLPGTRAVAAPRMDAKAFGKMTKGKLAPEARIDLHGLTLAEAQPELIRFILNAQASGLRLVLVITGKGKRGDDHGPIPQRMGALRHQVPQWLRLAPLAPVVLQVAEAHLRHGGTGAYYIYLRRK